ncbi:tetratricopeptide repeat protein [Cupriavidus basilensis]
MSLTLPTRRLAPARRAMTALAVLAALAGTAHAQNGPLSLAAPTAPPSGPRSADPGMGKAERAAAGKRYDEAIAGFDRVLAANPRNAQARFERARAMAQAGREDEAHPGLRRDGAGLPELPEPHNNLALLYAKRGDLKRAEAELLLATEVKPDLCRRLYSTSATYIAAWPSNPMPKRCAATLATRAGAAMRQLRPTGTPATRTAPHTAPATVPAPASAP